MKVPKKYMHILLKSIYFLVYNKKAGLTYDELKIGDVRYKHLTKTTIKVQLFWRLLYEV